MVKLAKTEYPVTENIKNRWSARAFSEQHISQDTLNTLLEAASWAFSANNAQPWEFVYAHRGTPAFEAIWACLSGGNQPWCKQAATFVVCLTLNQFENGKANAWALHDLGAANATMMLQATSMSIYGHPMAGFDRQKVTELLQLDAEKHTPWVIMALGYLDSPETLVDPYKTRETTPRTRRAVSEISRPLHL
ncbi:MAG: nitroreductase [Cytophagales bacterium]|nr:MAG: nitroreductase [Cytophagales bacterium]TAF61512.1 MAG: nitroreductase [Cytophagales bacterium]